MLEFDKMPKMWVASVVIFKRVEGETGYFQHIDAGKSGIRVSREHAPHCMCKCVVHRRVAGLQINRRHHDRGVAKIAGQRRASLRRAIPALPQPPPSNSENAVSAKTGGPLRQFQWGGMLQVEGQLCRGGISVLRINFETA